MLNNCPVCGCNCAWCGGAVIRKIAKYTIVKCAYCGLEYTSPLPTEKELQAFYSNYVDFRSADDVLAKNALGLALVLRSKFGLESTDLLLDYGCGKNIFAHVCAPSTWFGYDRYNPKSDLADFRDKKWDWITMWGVLEHLPYPKETLHDLVSCLSNNGKVALTTVDVESSIPLQYKPPEHLTYWTKNAIEKLFSLVGLTMLMYEPYQMFQRSDVYMDIILRTVPEELKSKIHHELPKYVFIPTNNVLVVGKKK